MISMCTNILGILKISMASLFLLGCSSGGSDDETVDPINNDVIPTNLSLSINLTGSDASNPNGDGTGQANFQVSASNAVRYAVKIDNNPLIESNSGSISYTFNDDGTNTYIVSAFAYSSTDNSISTFESVTVFVGNEPGYQLVWSDEFDVAGAPNPSYWTYDIGDGCSIGICGWGNGEEQFYTDRSDNVIVEDGLLKIMSKKESFSGSSYTSARIKTKGLFDFKYGKVEIRAKLPETQGTWPALWMLGSNIDAVSWPTCGEIDIMEQRGWDKDNVLGTCHWLNTNTNSNASYGEETNLPTSTTEFHVYKLEWSESTIKIAVDDSEYYELVFDATFPFDKEFFLLFNIAVGGTLGGTIDPSFTSDMMEIDYVRVYQ